MSNDVKFFEAPCVLFFVFLFQGLFNPTRNTESAVKYLLQDATKWRQQGFNRLIAFAINTTLLTSQNNTQILQTQKEEWDEAESGEERILRGRSILFKKINKQINYVG